jgi:3-hydroxyisobutyrate dehydrogenase
MAQIGFLGLGAMGSRMAANLLKAGHDVLVWNRTPGRAPALLQAGAREARTPREAATGAAFVLAMVRDDEASRAVWLDPDTGALPAMAQDAVAIECSTLSVEWVRRLHEIAAEQGVAMLDAPVSGSRPQAEAAQLIFFVGGAEQTFARAEPMLRPMAAAVHHAGAAASGSAVKLLVNTLLGVQVAAMAELIGLAGKAGLDVGRVVDIVGDTPVCSPTAKLAATGMATGSFAPQFTVDLIAKDFGYTLSFAEADGAAMPLAEAVERRFGEAIQHGLGQENMTAVVKLLR